jgi:hypothetical protein
MPAASTRVATLDADSRASGAAALRVLLQALVVYVAAVVVWLLSGVGGARVNYYVGLLSAEALGLH